MRIFNLKFNIQMVLHLFDVKLLNFLERFYIPNMHTTKKRFTRPHTHHTSDRLTDDQLTDTNKKVSMLHDDVTTVVCLLLLPPPRPVSKVAHYLQLRLLACACDLLACTNAVKLWGGPPTHPSHPHTRRIVVISKKPSSSFHAISRFKKNKNDENDLNTTSQPRKQKMNKRHHHILHHYEKLRLLFPLILLI